MKDRKHINVNLDFLEDNAPAGNNIKDSRQASQSNKSEPVDQSEQTNAVEQNHVPTGNAHEGKKHNWIRIFWVCVAILLFLGFIFSEGDSSSTTSYTPPSTSQRSNNTSGNSGSVNSLIFGDETFSCSDYHYDRAVTLQPDEPSHQIQMESDELDRRIAQLDAESNRIDNMYVNEYSQASIDNYNAAVNAYNVKRQTLQNDLDAWNLKMASYDRRVDAYNDYLDQNCRKRY